MATRGMNRRRFLSTVGAGMVGAWGAARFGGARQALAGEAGGGPKRPNIVLILSDDMGFSDIGCYGGEIATPNLDRLASRGIRFTQFYNTARCCPTRASLLTGLYPHQASIGHMTDDRDLDGYRGDLNTRCVTIAEALKPAGYSTYMAGKWHVTRHTSPQGPTHNWPLQRGFDRFYGTLTGAGSYYDPVTLTRDNTAIPPDPDGYYYTNAISDNAVRYVAEHKSDAPFFMYVAYTAAHWPMHALPEDIARHQGRYDKGWDALRAERHKRMIDMGLVDARWPITPRDRAVPAWENAGRKQWHARRREVYAAMIDVMDRGIGRIVAELERSGRIENTLILFLQDNGGCAEENGSQGPEKPDPTKEHPLKPMAPGELQRAGQPPVTRDGRPVRTGEGVMPGPPNTYVAYGRPWANASNTPFRLYKHWVHEGGIATPLIASWPAKTAKGGGLTHEVGHLVDIMATCCDAAGARYPKSHKGNDVLPCEGKSLVPVFQTGKREGHEAVYWEHEGNRAVRQGKWKLVSRHPGAWELYDMEADRTELNSLADKEPDRVSRMVAMYDAWAERCGVVPWNTFSQKKPAKKT